MENIIIENMKKLIQDKKISDAYLDDLILKYQNK